MSLKYEPASLPLYLGGRELHDEVSLPELRCRANVAQCHIRSAAVHGGVLVEAYRLRALNRNLFARPFHAHTAVERIWHIQDSHGQILPMVFR